ncbi:uncharacterized protein At3g28850 [Cucurbita maxima]|uniref:Uncharacterized protein At3g28850 n=1 Tax=Cucurbita maxima TaxID=3661 RepID=A0A6J1J6P6_CUCMA|nr:uncharacterized protein At3g28850 [Cucurbita maxima]XP_022983064.1 uncharacterized protein At3g28850 [Cucurbita maxima]XP_022983065.1 uncharacterized protein At3g28850 [Cucurbita maxima]
MKGRLLKKMKFFPSIYSLKQDLSLLSGPTENPCSQICETPPVVECSIISQHFRDPSELEISVSDRNHPDPFIRSEEILATKHDLEAPCLSDMTTMETNGGLQVKVDNHQEHSSLLDFEERCPPGGSKSIIFYSTSLGCIRKTFEECNGIRFLLESFKVLFFERDVSKHLEFREELWEVLGSRVIPPRLFIKGRYIGGADEVVGLHEQGKLRKLLEGIPLDLANSSCSCCANTRFLVCPCCNGSRKVLKEDDDHNNSWYNRCTDCNENGLAKCPICC